MEHKNLSLEMDKNLIEKILDDINMRYVILFLYVIRNDLFQNFEDPELIESYERVLILDEIFKGNLISFWKEDFTELAIDLGLLKNIRSLREFEQKDDDFTIKLGEETVTIEQETFLVPEETLFLFIRKKFKFLTKRNYNLALTRLKGVSCEKTGIIHPFIYQIGENDITLANDLYDILDQYGNIYQAIKMEVTIEEFFKRFNDIIEKINEYIEIYDSSLNSKANIKKINKAIDESKDILKYLRKEKVKLPDKFNFDNIDKSADIFQEWNQKLVNFLRIRCESNKIEEKLIDIKKYYSGRDKKYCYLEFIENVSFNDDNIVNKIQDSLIDLRKQIISIKEQVQEYTKKEIKLLNLDFERFLLMSSDD